MTASLRGMTREETGSAAGWPRQPERPWERAVPGFLLLAGLLGLAFTITVPYDIWWQLANGRLILQERHLVRADSFTFSIQGAPYLNKYWLFEIAAFLFYTAGGWGGLVAMHGVLLAGVALSVTFCTRRNPWWLFLLLAIPALLLFELRSSLRGYLLSAAMLPLMLRAAKKVLVKPEQVSGKGILGLAALEALWVNLHAEFPLGIVIVSAFALERFVKDVPRAGWRSLLMPAAAVAAVCAATLVNPFGWKMPFGILQEAFLVGTRPVSAEWLPFARYAGPLGWTAWALVVGVAGIGLLRAGRRVSVACALLFVFFVAMSLRAYRFVGLVGLVGLWVGMEHAPPQNPAAEARWNLRAAVASICALLLFLGLLATDRLYLWTHELKRFGAGYLTSELPVAAARFMQEADLRGRFLNDWSYGGYHIWHNGPHGVLMAEDGRTAPFPRELTQRIGRVILEGDPEVLREFDTTYGVDGAVVPWHRPAFLRLLGRDPAWHCLFVGTHSSVWMKGTALTEMQIADTALSREDLRAFLLLSPEDALREDPWPDFATSAFRRARFLALAGYPELAGEQVAALRRYAPHSPLLEQFRQVE